MVAGRFASPMPTALQCTRQAVRWLLSDNSLWLFSLFSCAAWGESKSRWTGRERERESTSTSSLPHLAPLLTTLLSPPISTHSPHHHLPPLTHHIKTQGTCKQFYFRLSNKLNHSVSTALTTVESCTQWTE